jgi:CxxC motif-containing protein (DUF1111 family)
MNRLDRISIVGSLELTPSCTISNCLDGIAGYSRNLFVNAFTRALCSALAATSLVSCAPGSELPKLAEGIFGELGDPLPSATAEQLAAFERGRAIALRRFTPADGLGPEMNVTFCGGCHEKPAFGGGASHYRDFLLVGDELDTDVVIPRGKNGVQPHFSLELGRAPSDPLTNVSATRNPIPFFGAGLLSEIPADEIDRLADPEDADGDGISGRANVDDGQIGRFGRKAQTSRLELFVRGPIFNHMGITSNPLSAERRAHLPILPSGLPGQGLPSEIGIGVVVVAQAVIPDEPTVDLDDVPDPELSDEDLFDLMSFVLLLAAPQPDPPTVQSERGRDTFARLGCGGCHVPTLNGPRGAIPAYSDLLLHDMGEELADRIPMGVASGREFRTQPLWGVAAVSPYLHDGRAPTLDEAIRWHGGEAAASKDAYVALPDGERADLIAFLESLGGRSQRTDGLLPPGAAIPEQDAYGAPLDEIDGSTLATFVQGRSLFDRDFSPSEGVGPSFNGDACRSCHFDPVIGGAGPGGVDAMRQGILDDAGFTTPSAGTALPRHSTAQTRPEADPEATIFERRQTPTTLGLGLLQQIPRETIEALADPDDDDEDGIAGRAHVLPDGRLGRFGWKADVPTVREFVRDALSSELGMTVPAEPGFTFGRNVDDDDVPDPEATSTTVDRIAVFVELLAPPPRTRTEEGLEDEGEAVFERIGCARCHVPELRTADGTPVRAYTDLLLHDVADPESPGIEQGQAGIHDFRTPPLWGLGRSGPYLHDGRAHTVEAAIEAHAGEAAGARDRFTAASDAERRALLAFLASL